MVGEGVDSGVLEVIRRVVVEEAGELGLGVERIILFGSRARGEARPGSDYDILVVVKGQVGRDEKRKLSARIRWRLAEMLMPADIIVVEEEAWRTYKSVVGHLFYTVREEGVPV